MGFFFEFVEDAVNVMPIETDARGFAGKLKTLQEARAGWRGRREGWIPVRLVFSGAVIPFLRRSSALMISQLRRTSAESLACFVPKT